TDRMPDTSSQPQRGDRARMRNAWAISTTPSTIEYTANKIASATRVTSGEKTNTRMPNRIATMPRSSTIHQMALPTAAKSAAVGRSGDVGVLMTRSLVTPVGAGQTEGVLDERGLAGGGVDDVGVGGEGEQLE